MKCLALPQVTLLRTPCLNQLGAVSQSIYSAFDCNLYLDVHGVSLGISNFSTKKSSGFETG